MKDKKTSEAPVELFVQTGAENEQTRAYAQSLHNRYNHSREQVDNSLVHIVLGVTLLIVGFLFLFLSNKMDQETFEKHITIKCFEFWVSMAGLVSGSTLLVAGLSRFTFQKIAIQIPVLKAIKSLQNNNYDNLDQKDRERAQFLAYENYKKS